MQLHKHQKYQHRNKSKTDHRKMQKPRNHTKLKAEFMFDYLLWLKMQKEMDIEQ